ncbi:MAG TPA: siderophore-interacting protein [Pseudonocardiaceae bacterium]|nr:siderophore-interacting protein [Pseudonocardiaceae bacterium]
MTATTSAGRGRARRHPPELWQVPVLRTAMVTPAMARITVGGPALANFPGGGGDQHVVLYFYGDVPLPEPLTLTSARTMLGQVRPAMRSYTVRRHDPVGHELDFDFVLHGDAGVASAWATRVGVGERLILVGPSPAYQPDPAVQTHVFVGDETALPAIGSMLARFPATATAFVLIEVADAAEEQPLPTPAQARITWLHRDGRPAGTPDPLVAALRTLGPLGGDGGGEVAVWAAGERTAMHAVRAHLLDESGLDRRQVRTTMYWRRGQVGTAGP